MSQSLKGKVAVVTGAASGIGLAAVEMLLRNDCKVVMVDRNAAALADLVAKYGDHAVAQVTDLLDVDSCNAMVPEILAKVGQIDILYCNAGAYIGGDLWQT
ncbi:MAG: SDR family NAD(P)-dependent oxidoreductase, partial [Tritonibacter mobilis]|nr:SDR family NAD(P)-dependent oxidoreductase [Tritonibacter mobilis]